MRPVTFILRVDFPALDSLVAYLTSRQQGQIDALAAKVEQLTEGLAQSTATLSGVAKSQPNP